jgi:hypothetical protein
MGMGHCACSSVAWRDLVLDEGLLAVRRFVAPAPTTPCRSGRLRIGKPESDDEGPCGQLAGTKRADQL